MLYFKPMNFFNDFCYSLRKLFEWTEFNNQIWPLDQLRTHYLPGTILLELELISFEIFKL